MSSSIPVKGGVIPAIFMPAVEKGVRQALAKEGGRRLRGRRTSRHRVYDGKTHAVDGEVAFVTAGRKAVIDVPSRRPTHCPGAIVTIEIVVPEDPSAT